MKSDLPLLFVLGERLCVWVSHSRNDATGSLQCLVKSTDVFLHLLQKRHKNVTLSYQSRTAFSYLDEETTAC